MFDDFAARDFSARSWDHSSSNHFAPAAVRNSVDVTGRDAREHFHNSLNLRRVNLHPGDVHYAAHSAVQAEISRSIEIAQITGSEETVKKEAGARFRLSQIGRHQAIRSDR